MLRLRPSLSVVMYSRLCSVSVVHYAVVSTKRAWQKFIVDLCDTDEFLQVCHRSLKSLKRFLPKAIFKVSEMVV